MAHGDAQESWHLLNCSGTEVTQMQERNGLDHFNALKTWRDLKSYYPLTADSQYTKKFLNYKYSSSIGNININNYVFSL